MWESNTNLQPILGACRRAKVNPAGSFHVLLRAHGYLMAMRGVPMAIIAE